MLQLRASVCVDASPEKVWAVLSHLEAITEWVPAIRRAHCPAARRGVGAARVCELDHVTIVETIEDWVEGRRLTYRGEGAPLMRWARNRWSVEAVGAQTLVVSQSEVEFKWGWLGRVLELPMRFVFRRLGRNSLAALKYFVERGERAPRSLAPLAHDSVVC